MSDRLLEICCDSLESARAAAEGGADRIELCVDLAADGLTPSRELLADAGELPVFVLVHCRPGDFVYTDAEVRAMCADIEAMREAGAAGIVCGALRGSGEIDLNATHRLIAAAEGLPFTFHKAFDLCPDQERSMERLAGLRELVKIPGVTEFHSAARASVGEPVDVGEVRAMRAILACR